MKIRELEEYAKYNGFDSLRFKFINLLGETKYCQWLDAWFGLFKIDGNDGFITVQQWIDVTEDMFELEIE